MAQYNEKEWTVAVAEDGRLMSLQSGNDVDIEEFTESVQRGIFVSFCVGRWTFQEGEEANGNTILEVARKLGPLDEFEVPILTQADLEEAVAVLQGQPSPKAPVEAHVTGDLPREVIEEMAQEVALMPFARRSFKQLSRGGILTPDQAAWLVGISKSFLYDLCRQGRFPHVRLGRRLVFLQSAIESWLSYESYQSVKGLWTYRSGVKEQGQSGE